MHLYTRYFHNRYCSTLPICVTLSLSPAKLPPPFSPKLLREAGESAKEDGRPHRRRPPRRLAELKSFERTTRSTLPTGQRMGRERRGAGSSLVTMETPLYKTIYSRCIIGRGECEDEQKRRRCEDEKMWRWEDVKMRRCEDEKMRRWEDVEMRRWVEDVKRRRCEDEKTWRWEDEKTWRGEDAKMRRCEDEMWGWEDEQMSRRCEEEKMWRWEDVKMRRWKDLKMGRWEDVRMRRCEAEKMRYVQM